MRKLLWIVVLGLLLSGNAYAGVNEPGVTSIAGCDSGLKSANKKFIKKHLKKLSKKNETSVLYASCDYYDGDYSWAVNKGKDLEKLHKKTYKQCTKYAKKHTGKECYLYAVNEEIVWKYDKAKASTIVKTKIAERKVEQEKQAQIDKKPGRFFEDQPDVSDDYQVHFFYVLAKDSKDKEIDVNGWLEKRLTTVNNKFEKWSKKDKKYNDVGQKFKFDYRKDGKIDITFVRMDLTKSDLKTVKVTESLMYEWLSKHNYLNNPKKTYALFAGFNAKGGNSHGGSGSPPITTIFIPAVKSYGVTDMDIVILHELFHTQGAAYPCGKRTYDGAHVKGSDVLGKNKITTTIDGKNDTYYLHGIKDCPDLSKSVYLTPTAEDSWDPYSVYCLGKTGNFVKNIYDRMTQECVWSKRIW
jgi:hypothetical protein